MYFRVIFTSGAISLPRVKADREAWDDRFVQESWKKSGLPKTLTRLAMLAM
jgi:hypothetical protein